MSLASTPKSRSTGFSTNRYGQGPLPSVGSPNTYGYNCVYVNSLSWSSPTTPLPMENNPRMVFERLFGEGGTVDQRRAEMRKDRSILDSVTEDMSRLLRTLGASDRVRVSQYVDAVREVERRIQRAEEQASESTLALPDRPVGIPESYDEHAKLLFDLLVLTYQADLTRVFSMQLGREQSARTYPWIGVNEGHHGVSHHQDKPEKIAAIAKINAYHIELLSYFVEKLAATPDGDGSLLDHSMVLHGSGMCNGNLHDHKNLPLVLLGGGSGQLRGGRHIKYTELTPMANPSSRATTASACRASGGPAWKTTLPSTFPATTQLGSRSIFVAAAPTTARCR